MKSSGDQRPRHEKVRHIIEERIRSGVYSANEPLPGVLSLASELDVSSITVRRAISDLRSAGVLRTAPGVGTFVNEISRFLRRLDHSKDPLYGSMDDAAATGRRISFTPLGAELRGPALPEFNLFTLAETRFICVKKIILIDEVPVSYDETFVSDSVPPDLLDDFLKDFIYQVLRKRKIRVNRTPLYFDAAPASESAARELKLPEGYPTIRNFYNPIIEDSSIEIVGVSISPFDRLGFLMEQ